VHYFIPFTSFCSGHDTRSETRCFSSAVVFVAMPDNISCKRCFYVQTMGECYQVCECANNIQKILRRGQCECMCS